MMHLAPQLHIEQLRTLKPICCTDGLDGLDISKNTTTTRAPCGAKNTILDGCSNVYWASLVGMGYGTPCGVKKHVHRPLFMKTYATEK